MKKLETLAELGQSIWYDYIKRSFLTSGELQSLVDLGLRGVTSNPAIFEKAIRGGTEYDDDIRTLLDSGKDSEAIYEELAMSDIRRAADILRPVYDRTSGKDGFVSLEVNPGLASDTDGTIAEGKRLFETVGKRNLMIKVPATEHGIPAISELIGSGVNVNVTLIFSVDNYRSVAEAYIAGLEKLADSGPSVAQGHSVSTIGSVASFFVSRTDTAVDAELERIGNTDLLGKIATANAKAAYKSFLDIVRGRRWQALSAQGAHVQRLLWASTGTKNPAYSDTLYIDGLIGEDTVNTVPPATFDSFINHGEIALTLTSDMSAAEEALRELSSLGVDLNAITDKLQADAVAAFFQAMTSLIESISKKSEQLVV